MAVPNYYPEGTAPRSDDTRLRVWTKILGAYQSNGGLSENNPTPKDTLRQIKQKLNKAIDGVV